ncbi:MAG: ATP-binding cassette domain-containing protein, partial [Bacteroidia bacterium]|nr:ATP-binding cassette domain-containing protein [Bacteroidia bacterium]
MNYLSAENIARILGERTLFENITIGIEKGDKVALVAPNGSGKTSMMRILAGLEPPDKGKVVTRNGIRVALLEQEPHFDPKSTVLESIF